MQTQLKRKLAIGVTGLAAVAFAGGAYAATQDSTNPQQAFLNDVAKRLNVTPAQLKAAFSGALTDQLQAAVKAGKLTQAEANAIEQRVSGGEFPALVPGFFRGQFRAFGPGFFGGRHFGLRFGGQLKAAAGYLGLSRTQLLDQLSAGKSLAEIAAARGKSTLGLKQAMLAAARAKLDRLVAAGLITSAQEQRLLSALSNHLDLRIQAKGLFPLRPGGPLPRPGFGEVPPAMLVPVPSSGGPDGLPAPGPPVPLY
jgi:hypothetical protein